MLFACHRASSQIPLLWLGRGRDIEGENIHREADGRACIRDLDMGDQYNTHMDPSKVASVYGRQAARDKTPALTRSRSNTHIDNTSYMTLDRDAAEHQVDLVVAVTEAAQVFDNTEAGLAIGNGGVHVVLLAVLVDAEALKVDHAAGAELRLHRAGDVDGRLAADHAELGLAVFDHLELDGDDAGNLDGAAEGDFAVALCVCRLVLSTSQTCGAKNRKDKRRTRTYGKSASLQQKTWPL